MKYPQNGNCNQLTNSHIYTKRTMYGSKRRLSEMNVYKHTFQTPHHACMSYTSEHIYGDDYNNEKLHCYLGVALFIDAN